MKSLIAFLVLVSTVSSFAQSRNNRNERNENRPLEGQITMRDGRTTVRINVDNDRDTNLRIRRLEQAVRDLQDQVYDLQDSRPETKIVTHHVCSLKTPYHGTQVGKATSRVEAEADARNKCVRAGALRCDTSSVVCERVDEEVVLR